MNYIFGLILYGLICALGEKLLTSIVTNLKRAFTSKEIELEEGEEKQSSGGYIVNAIGSGSFLYLAVIYTNRVWNYYGLAVYYKGAWNILRNMFNEIFRSFGF